MFGDKAVELIKELHRTPPEQLPPLNEDLLRQVYAEMNALYDANRNDAHNRADNDDKMIPSIHMRHHAIGHDRRCVLAYVKQRLNKIQGFRWDYGAVLPDNIQLHEYEKHWFNKYNKSLATYMMSLNGLDITQNTVPPKSLKVQVRCLKEYGELETESGDVVMLTANSEHFLPLSQCESLIKQGVLQHMGS